MIEIVNLYVSLSMTFHNGFYKFYSKTNIPSPSTYSNLRITMRKFGFTEKDLPIYNVFRGILSQSSVTPVTNVNNIRFARRLFKKKAKRFNLLSKILPNVFTNITCAFVNILYNNNE